MILDFFFFNELHFSATSLNISEMKKASSLVDPVKVMKKSALLAFD